MKSLPRFIAHVFLCSILAAGCGIGTQERLPKQDEAEAIVWREVFHNHGSPPEVEWVRDLPCAEGRGFYLGYPGPETMDCVFGVYWNPPYDYARVAIDSSFSASSYAHEFYHAHLRYTTGNSEPQHDGPGWKAGGILEQANTALQWAGL
jgi:hypothetical protein